MDNFKNDTLGFGTFLVDEQVVSLLNQLAGGYVRLSLKAKNNHLVEQARLYKQRFNEIGKARTTLQLLSYDQKVQEIKKYERELKKVLEEEKAR